MHLQLLVDLTVIRVAFHLTIPLPVWGMLSLSHGLTVFALMTHSPDSTAALLAAAPLDIACIWNSFCPPVETLNGRF